MSRSSVRREIALYARLLAERGYSVAQEGNISVRFSENRFLITPTNLLKPFTRARDIVEIDASGNRVRGKRKPTSELFTHLEICKRYPDALAVVHAHPPFAVLCSAAGYNPLEKPFLPEAAMFLKNAVFAPYARPSTDRGAGIIRDLAPGANAVVMDRHGSFTWGRDLQTAFALLEILEKTCKLAWLARQSGLTMKTLDEDEIRALEAVPYG